MEDNEEEEKILIRRDYIKYIKGIEQAKTREKHIRLKNIGYNKALENYKNEQTYLCVLFGYLKKHKCNANEVVEILANQMIKGKVDVQRLLEYVVNNRITTCLELKQYFE